MGEDQLLINKFLKLLPDNFMEWVFRQLEQNMISVDKTVPIRIYVDYIEKYNLPFQDKNLKLAHSNFYKSFRSLQKFLCVNFFISNQATELLVLHPGIKETNQKKYIELRNQLEELLDNTKNNYDSFRKKIEKSSLKNNNDKRTDKKSSNTSESIFLKTLEIEIKGNYIIRGKKKTKINPTDKAIIYTLYFRSLKNSDECCSLNDLSRSKDINKSEKYIKNRITSINQTIPKIINPNIKLRIGKFIKNERGRGYHLNPKIFHTKTKK